jgi:nucleotide-binding universal stress UspA family protein
MYPKILVPVDGSDTSKRGLDEAITLALELKSNLHLLYVVDDYPLMIEMSSAMSYEQVRSSLRQEGETLLNKYKAIAIGHGVQPDTHLCEITGGRVSETIVEQTVALGCDLIVMGTHGRRGFSHMVIGSNAEAVVRSSPVPVLLVRLPSKAQDADAT